jgi:mannitol/fructose-specific phosphotransferase system IIA component (Ntr-type)
MSAFGIEIDEACVRVFGEGVTKNAALDALVAAASRTDAVKGEEALRQAIYAREETMSTGIGGGVAIPHVRIDEVTAPVAAVGVSRAGIDFASIDGEPVYIVVLLAMPRDSNRLYLGLLAQLMAVLKVPNFSNRLIACDTPADVVAVLNESGG